MAQTRPIETETGALETPTETQQGLFQRWVDAIKTHSQVAFLALGIGVGASVIPVQQVQAQEVYTIEPAVLYIPAYSDANPLGLTEQEYDSLVDKFTNEIDLLPQKWQTEVEPWITVEEILLGIKFSSDLDVLFDRLMWNFRDTGDILGSIKSVYDGMDATTQVLVQNSQGVNLAGQEYVLNTITTVDKFTTGRFADRDIDWKEEKAMEYFIGDFRSLVEGDNVGGEVTTRLVNLSPTGTQLLLLLLPQDNPIITQLQIDLDILEQNAIQAEQNAIQAATWTTIEEQNAIQAATWTTIEEQNAIQAELRKIIETLRANS